MITPPHELRNEIVDLKREVHRWKLDYFMACEANQRLSKLLLDSEAQRIALARHIRLVTGSDHARTS